jgi:hypothetical protein
MSTYLSGSPTYLPTVQPFQPNLQLFAGSLQFKQTQYDTNRKKISDLYGSLLNSSMSRDSNIQARDEFFKSIDYEIKKLANVDLSLEQNVTQAAGLFNSMYDNQNIVKDMIWTKNYNSQMQRAEGFRNCVDPEKCGGQYWEGGVQAMEWKRDEFRKASDDDAMRMGDVNYTPYVNVQDMAAKMFKDMDWDVKMDTPDGMWIVTTKNGQLIEGNLLAHFQKTLGEDPRINEYYKTKAYLERKNWSASNAAQYGSQEAAEQEYINQSTRMINESLAKVKDQVANQKENTKQIASDLQENVENGDVLYDQQVKAVMDDMFGDADAYETTENQIGNVLGSANNSVATRTMSIQGDAVDNAIAMMYLDDDLKVAAHTMAYTKYEQTLKENTVAMKEQEHRWRMDEIAYKASFDEKKAEEEMIGNDILSDYLAGGSKEVIDTDPMAAYKMIGKDIYEEVAQAKTPTLKVLNDTFEAAKEKAVTGGNGSAQAGQDLVAMVDQAIRSKVNTSKYSKDSSAKRYADKLQREWNSKSAKEKLGWAKQFDMEAFSAKLPYDAVHKTYSVVGNMYKNTPYNLANRTYLNELKSEIGQLVGVADEGYRDITALRQTRKTMTEEVINVMVKEGGSNSGYYKYLANEMGNMRSADGFAFMTAMGETNKSYKEDPLERWKNTSDTEQRQNYIDKKDMYRNIWAQMSDDTKRDNAGGVDDIAMRKYIDRMLRKDPSLSLGSTYNPAVKIEVNGKTQLVPIDDFFTKDGLVRSAYAKYQKSWKPSASNSFWEEYKFAKDLYRGKVDIEGQKTGAGETAWYEDAYNATKGALGSFIPRFRPVSGYTSIAMSVAEGRADAAKEYDEGLKSGKIVSPFITDWKAAHVKALDKVKKEGFGSYTANDLVGIVDYSNPKSKTVMGDQSFLVNAFEAEGNNGAIFKFGGPGNDIPLSSDAGASDFVRKMMSLAIKSIDKEGRPTWTGTFNKYGGGKEDWQQYTIRVNETALVNAFGKGTEGYNAMYELLGSGQTDPTQRGTITVYLKDSEANNLLHQGTKLSAMEKQFQYSKTVPVVTGHYDDMHTLKLTKQPDGGYKLHGGLLKGIDENGVKDYQPISKTYYGSAKSPDEIRAEWMNKMEMLRNDLK